ncbi:glycosyltransferase N-terminal domain-containing protein [Actibacterium sp. MT2.3-13A]|uniref:3-deoxy-D-manno-octulosonic acid transferase n=1 Tax=Actibacterium sp. MT2.3-13A TaxID=2828332 RepID=UPI001BAE060C|nr:glycosyltransferase N-terminal domain-containing protein [Actibacterium sp. MT2.3-13A]
MGPSLSLWLYQLRTRLTEAEAPPAPPRPEGPLLWLHCPGGPGAAVMLEIVRVARRARPKLGVLLTGPGNAAPVPLPPGSAGRVTHLALPPDGPASARALLEHWRPDIGLFCSADLPPALIAEAGRRGVPLGLFADGAPEDGMPEFALRTRLSQALMRRFDRVFLGTEKTAAHFRRLGLPAQRMELTGPLSDGPHALPCNEAERETLARGLAGRPTWLAMGLTAAETPIALAAHAEGLRMAHRLLLILVPDDPARGPALAARLREDGWRVALRSDNEEPSDDTQIYIADLEGERGLWFRLAPISFLGQTYGAGTPPDPFAPAALGSAVLHGPATGAQADRFGQLARAGAARQVEDSRSLGAALIELLSPEQAAAMAHAAWDVSSRGAEATDRVVHWIFDTLDRAKGG